MKLFLDFLKDDAAVVALSKGQGQFSSDEILGVSLLAATAYLKKKQPLIVLAPNFYNAQKIYELIATFVEEENCLFYPVDELLRAESLASSKEMMAQRLYVMNELLKDKPKILIAHNSSIMRYLPSPTYFQQQTINLKVGLDYDIEDLKQKLTSSGYLRVSKIDRSLQYAVRGAIIDIYTVSETHPLRLEFFDNQLESLRYFDIATQTSFQNIDQAIILPASDVLFEPNDIDNLKQKVKQQLKEDQASFGSETFNRLKNKVNNDLERIENYEFHESLHKYLAYAQSEHFSILNYVDKAIIFLSNYEQSLTQNSLLLEEEFNYQQELFEQGLSISRLGRFQDLNRVLVNKHRVIKNNPFISSGSEIIFPLYPIVNEATNRNNPIKLIEQYLLKTNKLIITLANPHHLKTLIEGLKVAQIPYEQTQGLALPKDKLAITSASFVEGFELPQYQIALLTNKELFNDRLGSSRFANRYKEAMILRSFEELNPGDYVVHEQYGIGRFANIETIKVDTIFRDYLKINYAGTDVLYVPLSQFNLVRRFSTKEGAAPRLHRLNSKEWEKTKKRIKEKVSDLADRLIALYQQRAATTGFAFEKDDDLQHQFDEQFSYELTSDQKKAWQDIKLDMEKNIPMDRLVCGDVGFGKTELAFKAAFKAIKSGKQVLMLCPTTLLARQHYEVATARFANFGVNIAQLSRLIVDSVQKKHIKDIQSGKVHFIIGTHRALSKQIDYPSLGLLIIDEEQRFGVEQKEQIKELKQNIDVLTLSATPIPRTLQMSMLGIRALSQLNTPIENRMPIQTYIIAHNNAIIKELIERELGRGGQIFYLHNQVNSIDSVAQRLEKLVKGIKIGVVHGQMNREQIEDVMIKFYNSDLNTLVCTSIIENGIDIANANLILIENAQNFGLAQLYQIKGRVGRGNRIAFAYLLYKPQQVISEEASKRLKAIQDLTELGSGYKIAQRDLMIRGAGDILGAEQAGFIDTVGIDMYIQLLNEAIHEKQTGQPLQTYEMATNLAINAYIPEQYATKADKIELYQEIDNAKTSADVDKIRKYITDLYGRIPEEVQLLLRKRQLDLFMRHPALDNLKETEQYIELNVSKQFTSLPKSGTILFEKVQLILPEIRVFYQNRQLAVRLFKKGHWFDNLENLVQQIIETYEYLTKI